MIKAFPLGVAEKIGYYVYLLSDPRTNQVFYVGKGKGDRVFYHANGKIEEPDEVSEKLAFIREILRAGYEVKYTILRHGLTEENAFEVEAALIDYVGIQTLTNQVQGANTDDRGRMSMAEIIAKYEAPQAEIKEPVILINVNRQFQRSMTETEIYEITRRSWVIGERRKHAHYAFTIYNGIIRAVFEIERWRPISTNEELHKKQKRWEFDGKIAVTLQHYVGCSVVKYTTLGAQNPIRYINC